MTDFHFETVPLAQVKNTEDLYQSEVNLTKGDVHNYTLFNLAYSRVHSPNLEDVRKGIPILQKLCVPGTDQRDYVYYLGLAFFRLGEYEKALAHTRRVLTMEPNNRQAQALHDAIQSKLKSDGALGMAIVTGGLAIGVGLAALLLRR